jgi:LysM repeat protein
MGLFRLSGQPGSGEEEREFVLDTDPESQAPARNETEAEAKTEAPAEAGAPAQGQALTPENDSPHPGLSDIHRDGENAAQESTPASESDDIPVRDLLSDLVGVSRRLGVGPQARADPPRDETPDVSAAPAEEKDATEPDDSQGPEAEEPDHPQAPQVEEPSPTGYQRYALPALFLGLALAAAIGGFIGAQRLARTVPPPTPPAQSQVEYPQPPIVVATVPAATPEQDGHAGTAADSTPEPTPQPTPEPTPEATPGPTSALEPAYFLYTVQPGDTVSFIAAVFDVSPDYIFWNNLDVIHDPDILSTGEEILVPSTDGIIYQVKPGDSLSSIATCYQIDVESILAFSPNGLMSPDGVIDGMVLILPGAVPPLPPRPLAVVEPATSEPRPSEPTPAPEDPTAPELQPIDSTPSPEDSPSFSIGHIHP